MWHEIQTGKVWKFYLSIIRRSLSFIYHSFSFYYGCYSEVTFGMLSGHDYLSLGSVLSPTRHVLRSPEMGRHPPALNPEPEWYTQHEWGATPSRSSPLVSTKPNDRYVKNKKKLEEEKNVSTTNLLFPNILSFTMTLTTRVILYY